MILLISSSIQLHQLSILIIYNTSNKFNVFPDLILSLIILTIYNNFSPYKYSP